MGQCFQNAIVKMNGMRVIVKVPPRTPSELAADYDVPLDVAQAAWDNLHRRSAVLLVFSGKIGAGKDTVAPLVWDKLHVPKENRVHEFYAKALKDEISEVFSIIRAAESQKDAVAAVMAQMGVTEEMATVSVGYLYDEVRKNLDLTPYIKTQAVRLVLQYWGTDVRRAQDNNYWVKKTLASTLHQLAKNKSVQITDNRFPNELDAALGAGAYAVRLEVSPEVQAKRIMARDGVEVTQEARNHDSETAMDNYEFFDVYLNTDDKTPEELAEIIANCLETKARERLP